MNEAEVLRSIAEMIWPSVTKSFPEDPYEAGAKPITSTFDYGDPMYEHVVNEIRELIEKNGFVPK